VVRERGELVWTERDGCECMNSRRVGGDDTHVSVNDVEVAKTSI